MSWILNKVRKTYIDTCSNLILYGPLPKFNNFDRIFRLK